MREILFRGKRTDNGEWVEGNLFIPDLPKTPTQICIGTNVVRITYDVIPETVGQYTGLTDSSGKNIFEGDILRYGENGSLYTVIFEEGSFCYSIRKYYNSFADCEFGIPSSLFKIIGNIHDNPELLNEND